jgi:hypothetical protein
MDISGIDKAELLAALYNGARQQGLGCLNARGVFDMSPEEAAKELAANERMYFDYLHGRVMKINLRLDEMPTAAYNRDNGPDAAERIIAHLRMMIAK